MTRSVTNSFAVLAAVALMAGCPNGLSSVAVTGISLDQALLTIAPGSTVQLTATVSPSNATDKSLTWTSGDENIATVDGSGRVTGKTQGSATISVTTTDGAFTDSCVTTVEIWTVEQLGSVSTVGSSIVYTDNQDHVGFELKACPGDTFPTGTDDLGGDATVGAFWVGETEVTYELWYAVKAWAENTASPSYTFIQDGREGNDGTDGANPTGSRKEPATNISWRDAIVWCNALTEYFNASLGTDLSCVYCTDSLLTTPIRSVVAGPVSYPDPGGQDDPYVSSTADGFRLPTTDEWELAARWRDEPTNTVSGYNDPYFTKGDSASGATTHTDDNSSGLNDGEPAKSENLRVAVYRYFWNGASSGYVDMGPTDTAAVGSKGVDGVNTLGCYDMSGNAFEWCFEWNPGEEGIARIIRGGCSDTESYRLAVGYSWSIAPTNPFNALGIRLVRSP
jgi:formylglycine-generating enzyme required for sulfatase activity